MFFNAVSYKMKTCNSFVFFFKVRHILIGISIRFTWKIQQNSQQILLLEHFYLRIFVGNGIYFKIILIYMKYRQNCLCVLSQLWIKDLCSLSRTSSLGELTILMNLNEKKNLLKNARMLCNLFKTQIE